MYKKIIVARKGLLRTMVVTQQRADGTYSVNLTEKQELAILGKRPWDVIPNPKNYEHFKEKGLFSRFARWYSWNYFCDYYKRGFLFHDGLFEPCPEVTEALRRLQLKEPHVWDLRCQRIERADYLIMNIDYFLPKEQWVKWEEESWYLNPYLAEIELEKLESAKTTGLKPAFWRLGDKDPENGGH